VHHTAAVPDEHVGTGLALNIVAKVLVRCPQDFPALLVQVLDELDRNARSHHPVGARLHRRAGVGIHHHLAVRMGVAEWNETVGRAIEIERALGLQSRHEHAFFRIQNLGGLAHEAHPGDYQCFGRMLVAKARHVERVRDVTAGLLGKTLQVFVHVVVRHQHRILRFQKSLDLVEQTLAFGRRRMRQMSHHLGGDR